ncbi:MAG: hypothetical protein ACOCUZ_01485, partial [bacterium]
MCLRRGLLYLSALATLSLAGCGELGGGGETGWAGTVDTLSNGALLVTNPAEPLWAEDEGWRLVEELRIGSVESEGPDLFGQIVALEMGPDGRMYVLERDARELRIFGPKGGHLRTVGRRGAGPGEFDDPIGMGWHADGELWVVDPGNGRFSVFTADGDFVRSHPRPLGAYSIPWPGGFGPEGEVYERGFVPGDSPGSATVIRFAPDMSRADTFPLPAAPDPQFFELVSEQGSIAASVPFAPSMVRKLDPRGFVWFGISDRFRLIRTTLEGDTLLVVEKPADPEPVTAEEREEALERLEWFTDQGGEVDPRRIPSEKPVLGPLFVVEGGPGRDGSGSQADPSGSDVAGADLAGHLFVAPFVDGTASYDTLTALDPDGRYLGEVAVDPPIYGSPPPVIREDRILAVTRDDLGVPYVVRYR